MALSREDIIYRGYRIIVQANCEGWAVSIYRPGDTDPQQFLHTLDPARRDNLIAAARIWIDGRHGH